jgi:hypothetical protein
MAQTQVISARVAPKAAFLRPRASSTFKLVPRASREVTSHA